MNSTNALLIPQPRYSGALAAAVVIALLLGLANLLLGDLNQDEGWYLYAAREVSEGRLPYRDYAFTQGPMMPLVYSVFAPVIRDHGVAGGRVVTWLLGIIALVLATATARRLGGRAAAVMAYSLIALNVYQSYFTSVVKTYSLCALFLCAALYALTRWIDSRRALWLAGAGVALALAAGTRISSGIMLPLVGLWLLFQTKRYGTWSWLWFGLGGGITLLVIFLPFYLIAPEGFTFGLIEYHTKRDGGSLFSSLVLKAGFVSRLVQAYFVAAALLVFMIAAKVWRPFKGIDSGYHQTDAFHLVRLMWLGVIAMTLVHIIAPFPYDDYQVPVYPVLAVALAVSWSYALRAWSSLGFRWSAHNEPSDPSFTRWFVWSLVVVCAAASFASPINQEWMIAGRDRIWWNMKSKPSLLLLREVGREIKAMDQSGELLTHDTYLAVESGLKVPRGWEMGPFSYYPELPDDQAAALHLTNRRSMLETLATSTATVAAISGYGLSVASPQVKPLDPDAARELLTALESRYDETRVVPTFGQAATTLRLYRLRTENGGTP